MNPDTDIPAWTRIGAPGAGGAVVLAVDFDGSGRREATFRDLVRLLPDVPEVWQAVPPPDEHLPGTPPEHYLEWWLGLPGGDGADVRAVLGYCAGGVFASALADAIAARRGDRPPVILFNPGEPTVDTLDRDFTGIVEGMTILADDERADLRERARRARAEAGSDFDALSARYVALYLESSAVAFERFGIDAEVGEQLTRLFQSYVRYLAAARALGYRPGWAGAAALTAREQAGSGFTAAETVFELSRAELLRSPEVAAAARELITGARSARPKVVLPDHER
ncbi:hypothetical protein [Actinomadura chibensis]|uniref:hypothetical protein n=1 Tax=Actinomadura chibensis TaxID=392828 RepID=UPI00082B24C2|nr:hypothetical protein [Actinomadura chibensis]